MSHMTQIRESNIETTAAPISISRSYTLQSVPDRHEPLISTILHY